MTPVAHRLCVQGGGDPEPVDKIETRHEDYRQHRTDQHFASGRESGHLAASFRLSGLPALRRSFRFIQIHIFSLSPEPFSAREALVQL